MSAHVPVTAEELAEIARLDAEATPGPWTTDGGQVVETEHQIDPEADPGERSDVCECLNYGRDPGPFRTGTARFIARARDLLPRLAHDLAERTAERDALAATVERLIREAGAIRLDERQRAEAEHRALADEGRQRDANRIERLEEQVARMRAIVDDADRAKAEHEKTRDELRRLHDVLSGAKKL